MVAVMAVSSGKGMAARAGPNGGRAPPPSACAGPDVPPSACAGPDVLKRRLRQSTLSRQRYLDCVAWPEERSQPGLADRSRIGQLRRRYGNFCD